MKDSVTGNMALAGGAASSGGGLVAFAQDAAAIWPMVSSISGVLAVLIGLFFHIRNRLASKKEEEIKDRELRQKEKELQLYRDQFEWEKAVKQKEFEIEAMKNG